MPGHGPMERPVLRVDGRDVAGGACTTMMGVGVLLHPPCQVSGWW
jgi:hypothetical protein